MLDTETGYIVNLCVPYFAYRFSFVSTSTAHIAYDLRVEISLFWLL